MKLRALALFTVAALCAGPGMAQPVQLTTTGGSSPTVSPDGNWVGYSCDYGIAKIPAVGGAPVYLAADGYAPDWSPVNDQIVYVVSGSPVLPYLYAPDAGLWIVDAVTVAVTAVVAGDFNRPAWSPDGTFIAVTGDPSVELVSFPAGEISTVPCEGQCHGEDPDWSPDGAQFCYEDGLELMVLPSGGGQAAILVDCGQDVAYPAWSPNGRYVAFTRQTEDYEHNHIWVVDVATRELFQVTSGPYSDYSPAWAPDTKAIYFGSDRSGNNEIWRIAFDESTDAESTSWSDLKLQFRR